MNTGSVVGKVGKFKVCFRNEQLTSHAGVVLMHELAARLGVEQIVDEELQVKQRERGYTEGQAIGCLVHNLLLGGECLRDLEVLRGDPGTQKLLAQASILAPRTAGEFLHKFDLGDIRDLQRVNLRLQQRMRSQQVLSRNFRIILHSEFSKDQNRNMLYITKSCSQLCDRTLFLFGGFTKNGTTEVFPDLPLARKSKRCFPNR